MKSISLKTRSLESLCLEKEIKLASGDSIYFMGICGTAMASLAVYLKQEGFIISGSDKNIYPPMSLVLKKANIPVFEYKEDNIQTGIKLIVVGNVISSSHIEIQKAKEFDIPILSLPEFLQQSLLAHTKNIVIVGTHGKSTTTTLMTYVCEQLGQNPGFFMGAFPNDFKSSFRASRLPTKAPQDKHSTHPPRNENNKIQQVGSSESSLEENALNENNKIQQVGSSESSLEVQNSSSQQAPFRQGFFVIEGDEYDTSFFAKRAKFFYYKPLYVILTGVEFDHADIYKDLEDIQKSFSKFLSHIPEEGVLVACIETQQVKQLLKNCKAPVLTYGINKGDYQIKKRSIVENISEENLNKIQNLKESLNKFQNMEEDTSGKNLSNMQNTEEDTSGKTLSNMQNMEEDASGKNLSNMQNTEEKYSEGSLNKFQKIEVLGPDKKSYQLLTPLLGWHNALNCLGVFILAKHFQWDEVQTLKAFKNFKGLKRRLELRFEYKGVPIFEDFAHHPTAIQASLSALKESYPEKRLIAIFEPRSFTARSDLFQKEYVSSFKDAELVFIAQPYQSPKSEKQLSVKKLVEDLKKEGKTAVCYDSSEQLEKEFKKQLKKGDLACFMSSGAFALQGLK